MVTPRARIFARKSQRGTTVVVIVLVTTLIAAIGIFAVRNATQVDLAVGYSRQAAQTTAIAELGTSATLAMIAVNGAPFYLDKMTTGNTCAANPPKTVTDATGMLATCFPMEQSDLEKGSADKLFKSAVTASGETGSFGLYSEMQGAVGVELTEMHQTNAPVAGTQEGRSTYFDVTLTTTGNVRPIPAVVDADECKGNIPKATVKKMMRARTVIGPMDAQQ